MAQIRLPFRISPYGYVDSTDDVNERIATNVRSAVATRVGERMMRGDYGTLIGAHLFDNLAPTYGVTPEKMLETETSRVLATYYPSVTVSGVTVKQPVGSIGEYRVTIQYSLDTDNVDRTATVTVARDLLTGN